jgi:hypothetical protein
VVGDQAVDQLLGLVRPGEAGGGDQQRGDADGLGDGPDGDPLLVVGLSQQPGGSGQDLLAQALDRKDVKPSG